MPSRALLLLNPRARRGTEAAPEVQTGLERAGLEVIRRSLGDPAEVGKLIRAAEPRVDRVITASGDGTLNTVLQGSVETLRATEYDIAIRVPMDINVDGEIISRTPARFRVFPAALRVFAPREPK
jgi:diacylglycerol kinase family enzyme